MQSNVLLIAQGLKTDINSFCISFIIFRHEYTHVHTYTHKQDGIWLNTSDKPGLMMAAIVWILISKTTLETVLSLNDESIPTQRLSPIHNYSFSDTLFAHNHM